jgi:CRISPR-associated protein Csm3
MKLKGYKKIEGKIKVISGLHIGGSTTIIEIGGNDNPVIKHPITREPYIPGSSLKGKMRSLLEWKHGKIETDKNKSNFGKVHECNEDNCLICIIFGSSAETRKSGPTRLIVRDATLDPDFIKKEKDKNKLWIPLDISEEKYENSINRITAHANLRNIERVVSGVDFSFEIIYRVFSDVIDGDDEKLFEHVLEGLKLIEHDTLGGAGSRGCGQVEFYIKAPSKDELQTLDKICASDFMTHEI